MAHFEALIGPEFDSEYIALLNKLLAILDEPQRSSIYVSIRPGENGRTLVIEDDASATIVQLEREWGRLTKAKPTNPED